jgi:hypothetical protein
MQWDALANGALLAAAADGGFGVFITVDKNLRHQQNLALLPLPVVVLDAISTALPALVPFSPHLMALLGGPVQRSLYIIRADGSIDVLGGPVP